MSKLRITEEKVMLKQQVFAKANLGDMSDFFYCSCFKNKIGYNGRDSSLSMSNPYMGSNFKRPIPI